MSISSRILNTIREISNTVEDDYLSLVEDLPPVRAPIMEPPVIPKEEMIQPPVGPVEEPPANPMPLDQVPTNAPQDQAAAAEQAPAGAGLPGLQESGLDVGAMLGGSSALDSLLSQQ